MTASFIFTLLRNTWNICTLYSSNYNTISYWLGLLSATSIHFLGHVINGHGISTDPAKVQVIRDYPVQLTICYLQAFLGLGNYYSCLVKDYAALAQQLSDILRSSAQPKGGKPVSLP